MLKWLRQLIWLLTWRRKLCRSCVGIECVSNYGPCYGCKKGSNYEYAERIPEDIYYEA